MAAGIPLSEAQGLLLMVITAGVAHSASNLKHARGINGAKSYTVLATTLAVVAGIGDFVALRSDFSFSMLSIGSSSQRDVHEVALVIYVARPSTVPLSLGVSASGCTRAILRALDAKCYRSNKRLKRNVGAVASLGIGFILLAICADPEVRLNAAMLQRRFSNPMVLGLLLLSLLVMLGVLSWIADIKSHSRANVVLGDPQRAFAAIAGLAGSYGFVFEKCAAEIVCGTSGYDSTPVRTLSWIMLMLLTWGVASAFHTWWRRSAFQDDGSLRTTAHSSSFDVFSTYLIAWIMLSILHGAIIFHEFRSTSPVQLLVVGIGLAAISNGLALLKFRPLQAETTRFLSDDNDALVPQPHPLLAVTESLLRSTDSESGEQELDAGRVLKASTYRPPVNYKTL